MGIKQRPEVLLMLFGRFVVSAFPIRHSSVGIGGDTVRISRTKLLQEGYHLTYISITIDADGEDSISID